ncbi:hypothetical protein ACIQ9J_21660 [Streptomyces sp. NPDC094153]|uniref:hypothetical protein n=1 Tax=Streptomyces sp. NPDC094153 TaxID=3366058 RepID=UPI0038109B3F
MTQDQTEEAIARALRKQGLNALTSDQWTRQAVLDGLREQRRRHADSPRVQQLDEIANKLADRLIEHVDVPPEDMATVLLAASGSVGALAVMHRLSGVVVSEILQVTADVLDQRASGGENR